MREIATATACVVCVVCSFLEVVDGKHTAPIKLSYQQTYLSHLGHFASFCYCIFVFGMADVLSQVLHMLHVHVPSDGKSLRQAQANGATGATGASGASGANGRLIFQEFIDVLTPLAHPLTLIMLMLKRFHTYVEHPKADLCSMASFALACVSDMAGPAGPLENQFK